MKYIKSIFEMYQDTKTEIKDISYQEWRQIRYNTIEFTEDEIKTLQEFSNKLDKTNHYYRMDILQKSVTFICRNPKKMMEHIFHIEKYNSFFIKYECGYWRDYENSYTERSCSDRKKFITDEIKIVILSKNEN